MSTHNETTLITREELIKILIDKGLEEKHAKLIPELSLDVLLLSRQMLEESRGSRILVGSFSWDESLEGFEYWNRVHYEWSGRERSPVSPDQSEDDSTSVTLGNHTG